MSVSFQATCLCGYCGTPSAGSTMRQQGAVFYYPHLCRSCKQAVSVDLLSSNKVCQECGSKDIAIYGSQRSIVEDRRRNSWVRRLLFKFIFKPDEVELFPVDASFCQPLETTFILKRIGYECPKCTKPTLRFNRDMLYD